MTSEELKRAIESLRENQAKNTTDLAVLSEAVDKFVKDGAEDRRESRAYRQRIAEQVQAYRRETAETVMVYRQNTQETIYNLITANEVTRDLAEKVSRFLSSS